MHQSHNDFALHCIQKYQFRSFRFEPEKCIEYRGRQSQNLRQGEGSQVPTLLMQIGVHAASI